MVLRNTLDAEARKDLDILCRHYKGTNASLRRHVSRTNSRASHSTTGVVSLEDLSATRRKRGMAKTILSALRSRPNKETEIREERAMKNYVLENYERDTRRIVRSEGINPIFGASSQSLVDDSDDDSNSLESELQLINEDVESLCRQSTGTSLPESQARIDSNETSSVATGEVPKTGPWSSFLWFFGCADEPMRHSPDVIWEQNQARRNLNRSDYRGDAVTIDGESQNTDYTRTVSEANHSIFRE